MKPQLVMLHGALANSSQFDAVIKVLEDKFDIYCPSFPGHDLNDD